VRSGVKPDSSHPRRKEMNRIEFLNKIVVDSKFRTQDEVINFINDKVILKCDCNEQGCLGWAVIDDNKEAILNFLGE